MNEQNKKQIQINATDEALAGKYANVLNIAHTREEFLLDFMLAVPPKGQLNSRVIVSPAHAKRMAAALAENIAKHEQQFGPINESNDPDTVYGFPVK